MENGRHLTPKLSCGVVRVRGGRGETASRGALPSLRVPRQLQRHVGWRCSPASCAAGPLAQALHPRVPSRDSGGGDQHPPEADPRFAGTGEGGPLRGDGVDGEHDQRERAGIEQRRRHVPPPRWTRPRVASECVRVRGHAGERLRGVGHPTPEFRRAAIGARHAWLALRSAGALNPIRIPRRLQHHVRRPGARGRPAHPRAARDAAPRPQRSSPGPRQPPAGRRPAARARRASSRPGPGRPRSRP